MLKALARIVVSPLLSLGSIGLLLLGASLVSRSGVTFLGGLLLPWLALLLGLLTLPTIGAAVRRFRIPQQTRRNHALEHGTIFFLRKRYGKRYKLSGRSEERGFRVAGARSAADIERAFRELMQRIRSGDHSIVVARGCGSNMVTAQACGVVLMAILAMSMLVFQMSSVAVFAAVLAILGLVALVRRTLAMVLQRRRFLLVDFSEASILSVDPIARTGPFERHPVHFVRTHIVKEA